VFRPGDRRPRGRPLPARLPRAWRPDQHRKAARRCQSLPRDPGFASPPQRSRKSPDSSAAASVCCSSRASGSRSRCGRRSSRILRRRSGSLAANTHMTRWHGEMHRRWTPIVHSSGRDPTTHLPAFIGEGSRQENVGPSSRCLRRGPSQLVAQEERPDMSPRPTAPPCPEKQEFPRIRPPVGSRASSQSRKRLARKRRAQFGRAAPRRARSRVALSAAG
jgi:hypothetical protein